MFFVRTAGPQDLEKVRTLLAETWHATYDGVLGADLVADVTKTWHSPEALKARLAQKGGEFLVADDGKRIGGMAFAAMDKEMAKTAILHQLYVHPDFQRQGIGRDLFAEVETCFPDAEILRLSVDPQNVGALAFYHAHGFVEVDRITLSEGPLKGKDAVVLEKPLG